MTSAKGADEAIARRALGAASTIADSERRVPETLSAVTDLDVGQWTSKEARRGDSGKTIAIQSLLTGVFSFLSRGRGRSTANFPSPEFQPDHNTALQRPFKSDEAISITGVQCKEARCDGLPWKHSVEPRPASRYD